MSLLAITADHPLIKKKGEAKLLIVIGLKKRGGKRKVQGMPQSQTASLPRHQEEEETDISKQAQNE